MRRSPLPVGLSWFDHGPDVRVVLWYCKEVARLLIVEEFWTSRCSENVSQHDDNTASAKVHNVSALASRGQLTRSTRNINIHPRFLGSLCGSAEGLSYIVLFALLHWSNRIC